MNAFRLTEKKVKLISDDHVSRNLWFERVSLIKPIKPVDLAMMAVSIRDLAGQHSIRLATVQAVLGDETYLIPHQDHLGTAANRYL